MTEQQITTAAELDALEVHRDVRDRDGDVWTKRADGRWETPETALFDSAMLARKWGPFAVLPKRRLRACVEAWPEAETCGYDPRCCRFPKSCPASVYRPEHVTEADLEDPAAARPAARDQGATDDEREVLGRLLWEQRGGSLSPGSWDDASLFTEDVKESWRRAAVAILAAGFRRQPAPDEDREVLAGDVRTLLPGLLSANYIQRWAHGSPAVQALNGMLRFVGQPEVQAGERIDPHVQSAHEHEAPLAARRQPTPTDGVWTCGHCGRAGAAHSIPGNPSYECVYEPVWQPMPTVTAEQVELIISAAYGQIATEQTLTIAPRPGPDGWMFPVVPAHWREQAEKRAEPFLRALGVQP